MKEKTITITVDGTNQGQWSNLLLELNLMKKAWRPFGVNMTFKAPGVKSIIEWGPETMITSGQLDEIANKYNKTKDPELKKLWYQKLKERANGLNNIKRRDVSFNSCNEDNVCWSNDT